MKSFEEKAQELMQSHPNEVRNMAKNGNKYERAVAEIILESVGNSLMRGNKIKADKKVSTSVALSPLPYNNGL